MRREILRQVKELKESSDIKEVANLLSTKRWIAIDATTDEVPVIILGRIG